MKEWEQAVGITLREKSSTLHNITGYIPRFHLHINCRGSSFPTRF